MADIYAVDDQGSKFVFAAAALAREVALPNAADVDARGRFPEESLRALGERGLLGLCVPVAYGGQGQGPATFVAVVEELAQACASTAMIYVMHVSAAQVITASTTLANGEKLQRDIAAGRHLTTLAFSEKGSRSQFWLPMSKFEKRGAGFVTNAFKSWVTSANRADSYVSTAQMPGAATPFESTLYLLRRTAKGVRVAAAFDGLGLRGNDSAPVSIEDCAVDAGDMLTEQGSGAKAILEVVLPWFAIGTAAMSNGICRAAVAATAQHLGSAGFDAGGLLRELPNLRSRLAEMNVRTEESRALLGHTLREMAQPSPMTPLYVLQSRLSALEAAVAVTDLGMKACGGAAYSKHVPLERLFRDARAGWVMAPTVDHLRDFVGRALTGMPLF
jgi:alkylation response protein AidB-like acyl-CoA dehydrogenase